MVIGILSLLIPLVGILAFSAWGIFIGLKRTRIRFVCVFSAFLVSLIVAFAVKNLQTAALIKFLDPFMRSSGEEYLHFILQNESLHDVVSVCGGALLAPWAFLLCFVLLSSVSCIVCNILFIIFSARSKNDAYDDYDDDEQQTEFLGDGIFENDAFDDYESDDTNAFRKINALPRVLIYAVAQVLLTTFVMLTPVVSSLNLLPGLVNEVADGGLLARESSNANEISANQILDIVEMVDKSPLVVGYRTMGGNAMCNGLSSFELDGQKSDLDTELTALTEFVFDIKHLYLLQMQDYTEKEIVLLREIDEDMHISVFLPVVAGEFIYYITDAWLDEDGSGEFLGMKKPTFEKDTTSVAAEPFEHILEAFHNDAHDIEALRADFDTTERAMEILIRNDVIESMNSSQTNGLVEILSSGTTVQELIDEFDKNPSFAPLSDDIVKIGMRAMGSTLKIPANADVAYGEFTDELANKINELSLDPSLSQEEKTEMLNTSIREEYEKKAGKPLDLDDSVLNLYSNTLLKDFDGRTDVSQDEMDRYFESYSGVQSDGGAGNS